MIMKRSINPNFHRTIYQSTHTVYRTLILSYHDFKNQYDNYNNIINGCKIVIVAPSIYLSIQYLTFRYKHVLKLLL